VSGIRTNFSIKSTTNMFETKSTTASGVTPFHRPDRMHPEPPDPRQSQPHPFSKRRPASMEPSTRTAEPPRPSGNTEPIPHTEIPLSVVQSPLSGNSALAVSVALSNLMPNTTYHYRLKATNSDGTTFGADRTFTTKSSTASCPPCSGEAPIVQNVTFLAGTNCRCSGNTSLTIGPGVTIQNNAQVTFDAPAIRVKNHFMPKEVQWSRWGHRY
jgi:hypothetical protein